VTEVIEAGATELEVEYKDRLEEVFAVGVGITSFESISVEARSLREELYAIAKKNRVVHISGCAYVLRVRIFESFGEDAFHVTIERS
jgi:hypothetical protein